MLFKSSEKKTPTHASVNENTAFQAIYALRKLSWNSGDSFRSLHELFADAESHAGSAPAYLRELCSFDGTMYIDVKK